MRWCEPRPLIIPASGACARFANFVNEVAETIQPVLCKAVHDVRLDLLVAMNNEIPKAHHLGIAVGIFENPDFLQLLDVLRRGIGRRQRGKARGQPL